MNLVQLHAPQSAAPAIARLSALAPLDSEAVQALERSIAASVTDRPRTELLTEGKAIPAALLVVEGWAARMRILPDGRRQFLSFLLPGELIGMCRHDRPLAVSTVVAITPLKTCRAPERARFPALDKAFAVSGALEEAYLLAQITRLGRLSALERLGDMMLELRERLGLAGLLRNGTFEMPLTQEMLADVLGLTPVHVNRMVQQARRQGWLEWRAKRVTVRDPAALASKVGRASARVQTPA
ncbi:MAG TPA: Crp/Fnr family transcriptional regulator [Croceibacterium sp.]